MANQKETPIWELGVYQWETSDPVLAGEGGVMNLPILQLAGRTSWLKMMGIPAWDVYTNYKSGSFCQVGGAVFRAIADNVGDDPVQSSHSSWEACPMGVVELKKAIVESVIFDGGSLNELRTPGDYTYTKACSSKPTDYKGLVKVWREDKDNIYQFAQTSDERLCFRFYSGGAWSAWTLSIIIDEVLEVKRFSEDVDTDLNSLFTVGRCIRYKVTSQTIANTLLNAPVNIPCVIEAQTLNNNHIIQTVETIYSNQTFNRYWNRGALGAAAELGASEGWSKWVESVKKGGGKRVIVDMGQSNDVGVRTGGGNPVNSKVKVWDASISAFVVSDLTQSPWTLPQPDGNYTDGINQYNNNFAVAFAHRVAEETGDEVYLIHDAVSGRSIDDWTSAGTDSIRYASIKAKVTEALDSIDLAGHSSVDYITIGQGEEDALTHTESQYYAKLKTWISQLRAESWANSTTPILLVGASYLHDRYAVHGAKEQYCSDHPETIFVSAKGLKTDFEAYGTGDSTHFTGGSLWKLGYNRCWAALNAAPSMVRYTTPFYGRGSGEYAGEGTAIARFNSLVSIGCATSQYPINSPSASYTLVWGANNSCGSYGMVAGLLNVGDGSNCATLTGRGHLIESGTYYSSAHGYRNTVRANSAAAFGEGHVVADDWQMAIGRWSKFRSPNTADPVVFQVGIGATAANAKNSLTSFQSGRTEFGGNLSFNIDNTYSVGTASNRASVIYAGTSAISTSDRRLKTVRGELTDAEFAAWGRVRALVYRFNDSVDTKGDEARLHVGYIAQGIEDAFNAEGLDVRAYALFCEDEVFEEQVKVVEVIEQRQVVVKKSVQYEELRGAELVIVNEDIDEHLYELKPVYRTVKGVDGVTVHEDVMNDDGTQMMARMSVMEDVVVHKQEITRVSLGLRLGLRYEQCAVFEGAYLRRLVTELSADLADLRLRFDN